MDLWFWIILAVVVAGAITVAILILHIIADGLEGIGRGELEWEDDE